MVYLSWQEMQKNSWRKFFQADILKVSIRNVNDVLPKKISVYCFPHQIKCIGNGEEKRKASRKKKQ